MRIVQLRIAMALGLLIGITRFAARETDRALNWLAQRVFQKARRPSPFNRWGRDDFDEDYRASRFRSHFADGPDE